MSSPHLPNHVSPRDHRHSTSAEVENNIEESLPRSFSALADSKARRESLGTELPSFDQNLSKQPPFRQPSRAQSKEMSIANVVTRSIEPTPALDFGQETTYPSPAPASRFLCDDCNEWITDVDDNEAEHAAICTARMRREVSPSVAGDASTSISVTPAHTAGSSEPRDNNTAFRRRKVKHYELERQALLQKDPQAEEVEEYRVLCGHCEKWIHLRKDRPYCPIAWTAHKLQCVNRRRKLGVLKPGPVSKKVKREHLGISSMPFDVPPPPTVQIRRTEEERLRFLESDPHATTVEPHRILCGICHRWIQLRKNSTYCTAPWVQHAKKCAFKHDLPRRTNGASSGYPLDEDGEDEIDSEDGTLLRRVDPTPKRGRGRPRKRKLDENLTGQTSFALRLVRGASPSPPINQRRSASPHPVRSPSPFLSHPYPRDMYWYPAHPPMSSYYPLYAGSQYNEKDDSYSLYFHAQPQQARPRPKPSKQHITPATAPASWHGGGTPPSAGPGSTPPGGSRGHDGMPQHARAWIVWQLKDYSANSCPIDPVTPVAHASVPSEASGSGSSSEPLPLYRSGTWPHLMNPEDPGHQQNLSPYVHPELGTENGSTSSAPPPSGHFNQLTPPLPRPSGEDPALIAFNSSAHIPIRKNEPQMRPLSPAPDTNVSPQFATQPPAAAAAAAAPAAPTGSDLDSAECRLDFTFKAIAYLFSTSFQGADDMSLDTLMTFMNRTIPHEKMYDAQEVSQHVAILGERKLLFFTKEGGVQLLMPPP